MSNTSLFTGVYPFLATPFTHGDQVDEARPRSHIEDLIVSGKVYGVTGLGSTGTFALMSDDERRLVAEISVDATRKRVPVVIGTSAIATQSAVALYSRCSFG